MGTRAYWRSFIYILVVNILCSVSFSQDGWNLYYKLQEEVAVGTIIGNILDDSGLVEKYSMGVVKKLHFTFLSEPRVLFSLDSSNGVLRTIGRIDRDKICPHKDYCRIDLDIAIRPVQYFQIIKATVEVIDLNDNRPTFPEIDIVHPILESATIGSSFVIPSAIDEDSPAFGVKHYELGNDSTDKFDLKVKTKLDGTLDVRLVLKSELDREVEDKYIVQVLAYDVGGLKPGKLMITIDVLDSNDNDPIFSNDTYYVRIPENVPVRSVIIKVHAADHDTGSNGRIVYKLSERTINNYGYLFGIDNQTGEIFVKGRLDHEEASIFNLIVTAADQGPDSLPAEATVVVHILDLNDNPPQITVNTLAASATNRAEISEDSPTGTFVAHVTVTDPDSGDNGRFNCSLNDNSYRLVQRYESEYQIITAATLDRERVPQYNLALVCRDLGADSQVAIKHIQVIVVDTNDHSPIFHKQKYVAEIVENNKIGTKILSVNASDRDIGPNADIVYSISREASKWFAVNTRTGQITARVSIDRERNDRLSFYVFAADRGNPAKTGSSIVTVTIKDMNDESPRFSKKGGYTLSVEENKPPGEEVGIISAEDYDGPEFNSFIFSLESVDRETSSVFVINPHTGLITTTTSLDREIRFVYYLRVIASDSQMSGRSSSVSVTIYVSDMNDNKPQFLYPTRYNYTVHISNKTPIGFVIAKVVAEDVDEDQNAEINYTFFSGNEEQIFAIDERSGAILTRLDLGKLTFQLYELHIMARDNGIPERYDAAKLNVIVNRSIPFPLTDSAQNLLISGHNFVIVISLACACAMITIILVSAVIFIRRKDRGKRIHKYNCRMEALRMLTTAKETLSPLASEESTPRKESNAIKCKSKDVRRNRLSPVPSPNLSSAPIQSTRYWHYSWQNLQSEPGSGGSPRSRNSHAACCVGGNIFLLGGKDGSISHKDMWKYNAGIETWESIRGTGDKPICLQGHTMTPYNDKLYIFGGKFNCGSDDESPFWSFDTASNIWEKNKQSSDVMTPVGRREHSAVVHQGALYIYGGYIDLKGSSSELWSYNFIHDMWHLCYCSTLTRDGPGGRHAHSAVVHNNNMWVFGGMNDLQAKDELWKWNFGVQRWTRIRAKGPPALKDHSACKLGDKMLIYGGLCDGQLHDQLWLFQFVANTWSKISVPGLGPPASIKHCAILLSSADVYKTALDSQTDRCFSSPLLGASAAQTSIENRPYSSPPSVIMTDGHKSFRNRIVPSIGSSKGKYIPGRTVDQTPDRTINFDNPVFNAQSVSPEKGGDTPSKGPGSSRYTQRRQKSSKENYLKKGEWGSVGSVIRYTDNNPLIDIKKSQTFSDTDSLNSSGGFGVSNPTFNCDTRGQFVRIRRSSETLGKDSSADGTMPMKRHRYSSQFSDDFVPYTDTKSASAESILSNQRDITLAEYPIGRADLEEHAPSKSQSLGSLNSHLSKCDMSKGVWEWEFEPRITSRDDLILEDIEDCGSELFSQMASNAFTNDVSLMDCELTDRTKMLPDLTTQRRKSDKCTHQSLVCLHDIAEEAKLEAKASNLISHTENPEQDVNFNVCTKYSIETCFIGGDRRSEKLMPEESVSKYKDLFVRNSAMAENKFFMYILGGKTKEAQHLNIKPLPVWKLEIDIV